MFKATTKIIKTMNQELPMQSSHCRNQMIVNNEDVQTHIRTWVKERRRIRHKKLHLKSKPKTMLGCQLTLLSMPNRLCPRRTWKNPISPQYSPQLSCTEENEKKTCTNCQTTKHWIEFMNECRRSCTYLLRTIQYSSLLAVSTSHPTMLTPWLCPWFRSIRLRMMPPW